MFFKDEVPFEVSSEQPRAISPPVIGVGILAVVFAVVAVMISHGFFVPATVAIEPSANNQAEEVNKPVLSSVYVHVLGCVISPGLYELPDDARVADAIERAGGFTDQAAQESVNLAARVSDGDQIRIASHEEVAQSLASAVGVANGGVSTTVNAGKVNINLASAEELQTLNGVGQSTAAKIVAYRQKNGPFSCIDDLKNVSGIGEKRFESLKSGITV